MTYAFITAAEAAATIHHGDTVGIGGFSSVGTPKAVPEALAAYAEAQHAQGKEFKVGLITGGATRCQVDSALVKYAFPVEQGHARIHQPARGAVF